jgi:serine/threonine protein kinase
MFTSTSKPTLKEIGRYSLLERIADGGMGTVYKARDTTNGEMVAIKLLREGDERAVARFEQEIAVTLQLSHPHLIRGLQHGYIEGSMFFVMEYVDGITLGERIEQQGRLVEKEAINLIVQVAGALHYMHFKGVIHRDVKPDNILLSRSGNAKLADLGLIKNTGLDLSLTRSATGLGSPNFMAPEQFSDAKDATAAYDVYSLGATLYMAVTGVLPFNARTDLAILKKKISNDMVPPRNLIYDLRQEVDLAIRRALRADPSQRFPGVSEFVQALTGRPLPKVAT